MYSCFLTVIDNAIMIETDQTCNDISQYFLVKFNSFLQKNHLDFLPYNDTYNNYGHRFCIFIPENSPSFLFSQSYLFTMSLKFTSTSGFTSSSIFTTSSVFFQQKFIV